jgi:hypothetical protein
MREAIMEGVLPVGDGKRIFCQTRYLSEIVRPVNKFLLAMREQVREIS